MEFIKKHLLYYIPVFLIILYALFIPPIIGCADNGDFGRVMSYGSINLPKNMSWVDLYYHYVVKSYVPDPISVRYTDSAMPTSTGVIVFLSRVIYSCFNKYSGQPFDIRLVSVIYSSLFLLATTYLLKLSELFELKNNYKRAVFAVFILIFLDTGYISYFNSFYSEPTIFVFVLLMLLKFALLYYTPSTIGAADIAIFSAYFIMFDVAKLQTAVYAPVFAFFLVLLYRKKRKYVRHQQMLASALTLIFILNSAICVVFSTHTPSNAKNANVFNSVFVGVLRGESNPDDILQELGLDQKLSIYQNHDFYQVGNQTDINSDDFKNDFFDVVSMSDITRYYIRHLDRFYKKVNDVSQMSGTNIPEVSKNLQKLSTDGLPRNTTFMHLWDNLRHKALPKHFITVIIFVIIVTIICLYNMIRKRKVSLFALTLLFCCFGILLQLPIKLIGDGIRKGETIKHLFLYNLSWDILVFCVFFSVMVFINHHRKQIKNSNDHLMQK